MATRAPRVPDHAQNVARQRLVEGLDLLSLCAGGVFNEHSSTAGGVQRVDLTGHILPGRRDPCVPQEMTGAHRATVSITALVGSSETLIPRTSL